MLERYPQQVKLVYKYFPLSSHRFAFKAATAAQAAYLQGKFWPVHDALTKAHDQLSDEKINQILQSAGLNAAQVEADRKSAAVIDHIRADYNEGIRVGVRGVPTVYIDGKRQRDRSLESLSAEIEKELKKPGKK